MQGRKTRRPNFFGVTQLILSELNMSQFSNLMSPEAFFHLGNCPPPTKTSFRLCSPGSLSLPDLQESSKIPLLSCFLPTLGSSPSAPLQPSLTLITFDSAIFFFKKLILLVYNCLTALLVSPVQQSGSTVCIHVSPLLLGFPPSLGHHRA